MQDPKNLKLYTIRDTLNEEDVQNVYSVYDNLFTIKLHHGGHFTQSPGRKYLKGMITYVDMIDIDKFSLNELNDMVEELGYNGRSVMVYHFLRPGTILDDGLEALGSDLDFINFMQYVGEHRELSVYIELNEPVVNQNDLVFTQNDLFSTHSEPHVNEDGIKVTQDEPVLTKDVVEYDVEGEHEDDDYFVDWDNIIEDVEVDMKEFMFSIDKDVEFMGSARNNKAVEKHEVIVDLDVLNFEDFNSDGDCEDGIEGDRNRKLKELRQQSMESEVIGKTFFYLGQEFASSDEVKERVNLHAIETRRKLIFVKNDKKRLRARCQGLVGSTVESQKCVGENIEDVGENIEEVVGTNKEKLKRGKKQKVKDKVEKKSDKSWKKRDLKIVCDWVLHVSKSAKKQTWEVVTCKQHHTCRTSRKIRQCTSQFLSTQLMDQLPSNPKIPPTAVKETYEKQLGIVISAQKAYRAKKKATAVIQGDYTAQYADLRDYLEELKRTNADSTVIVETEPGNANSSTRVFKRVYVCLGALKKGFKEIGRDLIGVDGAFMKEPDVGQLLTAVGVDSNNGIYPLAYALVDKENYNSWSWFLKLLGSDLGLERNSNFTFISDRQKGLLPAVENIFPCAEHRYCLRHLYQNMKKTYNGVAYKQHLWKCATATTVPHFEKAVADLKEFSPECYTWLTKVAPQHWARSHFTGRAISDVLLSNMCEVLNRWLAEGRDKPIITSLEYVREYMMKRILNVLKVISKSNGPLTPTATKLFDVIQKEADHCRVLWNGSEKYQVSGPGNDQVVVDMAQKVCACRKWELTGMPCKHVVAVLWNMDSNEVKVGSLESWVHPVYWLDTWKKTYNFTIDPLNGRSMWPKSTVPNKIVPPGFIAKAGRPKKNRKKGIDEKESMNANGKLSRKGKTITCGNCKGIGHNRKGCKIQVIDGGSKQKGTKRKADQSASGLKKKASVGPSGTKN